MALWNYPGDYNVTNFTGTLQYIQYTTNNSFIPMILITLFVVIFVTLKQYETQKAFSVASFVTGIAAIFFRMMGLVGDYILAIIVVMLIVAALWDKFKGE